MTSGVVWAKRVRRRQAVVALAIGAATIGAASLASGAGSGLTITPASGAPGSSYKVSVECGEFPSIFQKNTQDAYVQGTVGSYGSDQVSQVSPSFWEADETAGNTDRQYWATCGQVTVGTGRFDAEAPHLWLGPRPQYIGEDRNPRTTVEGTDCPAGTTATVRIGYDGDLLTESTPEIDEYGDWSVTLPAPVGSKEMMIDAWCGAVTYDRLQLTTTSTSGPDTVPATVPPTTPPAPGAVPQSTSADYTG